MCIDVTQYRQAIGLYNRVKMVKCCQSISFVILPMLILSTLLITMLLFMSGLELNPGPVANDFKLKYLTACHVNIRGLSQSKLNAIKTSLCNAYDVITLSETFLSTKTHNTELSLPGFQEIIRRDRTRFGGGVAVYIRNGLSFKRLIHLECDNLEQI